MSAHTILVCHITPGREDEARNVLRDYASYLEGHGAQVTIYRNLYAGEQSGRLLVYAAAPTTAGRAAFIDRVLGDAPNNPYSKAIASSSPAVSGQSRTMVRSLDPDVPMLPQSRLRLARVMSAPFGRRREVAETFERTRQYAAERGVDAAGYLLDVAGTASDNYAFVWAHDSMASVDAFEQNIADSAPPPGGLADALSSGLLTPVSRRIDWRYEV